MAVPLQDLLKQTSTKNDWGEEHDAAVKKIKKAFVSPALLRHYDPSLRTILQTEGIYMGLRGFLKEKCVGFSKTHAIPQKRRGF